MSCEGKERFTTFALAERVVKLRRRAGVKREPYRCSHCGSFHIGSTLGRAARRDGESRLLVLDPA